MNEIYDALAERILPTAAAAGNPNLKYVLVLSVKINVLAASFVALFLFGFFLLTIVMFMFALFYKELKQ